MTSPPRARVALIGVGLIGQRHIAAFSGCPASELVGIADSNQDRLAASAAKAGVPGFSDAIELIEALKPDGVIVATPTDRHLEPTLAALEAGCGVLVEKPIAADDADANRIVDAERGARGRVLVGHHRRHNPAAAAARKLLGEGALGRLVMVSGEWAVSKHDGYFGESWRRLRKAGPVLINMSHDLDMLRYICGEMESVSAEVSNAVMGCEKEDAAAAVIRFQCGALGAFALSDRANSPWAWEFATGENPAFPPSGQNCYRFIGTERSLEFPQLRLWSHKGGEPNWFHPMATDDLPVAQADAFALQAAHFSDVARSLAEPLVTASDAAKSLRATLAVFESAESGRRILL